MTMKSITVNGGRRLNGRVRVGGSKNASLPILFASLTTAGTFDIHNVPDIGDIRSAVKLLSEMGADVTFFKNTVRVNTERAELTRLPVSLCGAMRASSYLIGACLARFGEAMIPPVGGCDFGGRPLDMHIGAAVSLGAVLDGDRLVCKKLHGGEINFNIPSVGATVNALIMSSSADGESVIRGAAREPHIVNLCDFLRAAGADISGDGSDVITVRGCDSLVGRDICVIPDMIEAGTFAAAVMSAGGCVYMDGISSDDLGPVYPLLGQLGAHIEASGDTVFVSSDGDVLPACLTAAPYPGIPTDMHPQLAALLGVAPGRSKVCDTVWKNRFRYIDELSKMGYNIRRYENIAYIDGVKSIHGAQVTSTDLRAGAALIIASLRAEGRSDIAHSEIICRGYDGITDKLRSLGADIRDNDV